MNTDQLKKANEISESLKRVNNQIENWAHATHLESIKVQIAYENGYRQSEFIDKTVFDFGFLKTFALTKLNQEQQRLQTEFEQL